MGKCAVISGVLVIVLCSVAQAHRPIFSDKAATDPNTAVMISQPAFGLFIQIGVPVLDRLKEFRPSMLVVGPGLPEDNVPFPLPEGAGVKAFPTDSIEEPRFFHEHFTGTDSWILRSDTVKLPGSGRYYLVAYVPSGVKGKLWLSVDWQSGHNSGNGRRRSGSFTRLPKIEVGLGYRSSVISGIC